MTYINLIWKVDSAILAGNLTTWNLNYRKALWSLFFNAFCSYQGLNFILFLMHVLRPYVVNIFAFFILIAFEGILGGISYVNTFHRVLTVVCALFKTFFFIFWLFWLTNSDFDSLERPKRSRIQHVDCGILRLFWNNQRRVRCYPTTQLALQNHQLLTKI